MVMIDPLIPNLDILVRSYMYGDAFSGSTKVIEDSIKFAGDLMKQFPEQVTVKTIAVPMTYSFMQIKKKNYESIVKIDIYAPLNNSDDRFSMIIDNIENKEMYDYYTNTFYKMFFDGKPIIPE